MSTWRLCAPFWPLLRCHHTFPLLFLSRSCDFTPAINIQHTVTLVTADAAPWSTKSLFPTECCRLQIIGVKNCLDLENWISNRSSPLWRSVVSDGNKVNVQSSKCLNLPDLFFCSPCQRAVSSSSCRLSGRSTWRSHLTSQQRIRLRTRRRSSRSVRPSRRAAWTSRCLQRCMVRLQQHSSLLLLLFQY